MLEAHQKGKLTVTTEVSNNMVKISFADDGPGISEAIWNGYLTRFSRLKKSEKGPGSASAFVTASSQNTAAKYM